MAISLMSAVRRKRASSFASRLTVCDLPNYCVPTERRTHLFAPTTIVRQTPYWRWFLFVSRPKAAAMAPYESAQPKPMIGTNCPSSAFDIPMRHRLLLCLFAIDVCILEWGDVCAIRASEILPRCCRPQVYNQGFCGLVLRTTDHLICNKEHRDGAWLPHHREKRHRS